MKYLISVLILFILTSTAFAGDAQVVSAIEIGSKGIKALAYEISGLDSDEQYIAKKIYDKKINPNIMSGVSDGYLKQEKINEATEAVKILFHDLKKLDPQFIVIVSSTAFDKIKNKPILESQIQEATGQAINFITSDDEIYYGLLACVPQKRIKNSILIDVGSGNTKLGYATPMSSDGFESITFKYGTITFKEAAKNSPSLKEGLAELYSSEIRPTLKKALQDMPGLGNPKRRIYIVGGASWFTANLTRPQDIDKQYVYLKLSEIKDFRTQIASGTYVPKLVSGKAEKTISDIYDVFSQDDLVSGSTLLTSLLDDLNGGQRKIIFPRDGGWIVGYMFSKYNQSVK